MQAQGFRASEDIGVIGFDDFAESRVVTPPLTTVNPSWYELGQQEIETLLHRLAGDSVPEMTMVPARLSVWQSCGCLDPVVVQAAVGPLKRRSQAHDKATGFDRKALTSAIVQAAHVHFTERIQESFERLLDSLEAELKGASRSVFLSDLDGLLRQIIASEGEIAGWHEALSILRRQILPSLGDEEAARAEDSWQRARVMVGKMVERVQVYKRVQAEQRANRLNEVGQALITTFDVDGLMDILAEGLPRLGFTGCYLSLCENPRLFKYPDHAPEWSRLVLAYNENGRVKLEPGGLRFRSRQLAPPDLWPPSRPSKFVAEPFYFRNDKIGFALFKVGPRDGSVYEVLRGQISSALKGALLIRHGEKRARQSQKVAEVGAVVSAISRTSELLQTLVDLAKDSFDLYDARIFVLDETGDTLVLAAGAGQAGRQMAAEGWRIPVRQESSLVANVARSRHAAIVNDVRQAADWLPHRLLPHVRAEMAVPLIAGDRILGVLHAQSDAVDHFTQDDLQMQIYPRLPDRGRYGKCPSFRGNQTRRRAAAPSGQL